MPKRRSLIVEEAQTLTIPSKTASPSLLIVPLISHAQMSGSPHLPLLYLRPRMRLIQARIQVARTTPVLEAHRRRKHMSLNILGDDMLDVAPALPSLAPPTAEVEAQPQRSER